MDFGELMAMPPTRVPDAIALMSAEASAGARVAEAQAKLAEAMAQLQALERLRKTLKH